MLRLRDEIFSTGRTGDSAFRGIVLGTHNENNGMYLTRKAMIMKVVTNPAAAETIVVGGKTYTFRATVTVADEIKIGNLLTNGDFANGNDGNWGGPNWTIDATGALHVAGPASGTVDAVADYSATVPGTVLVTDTAHGLNTGATITIAGTSSYNGTFVITKVGADSFYIYTGWISNQTGTWTCTGSIVPLVQEWFPKTIAGHTYVLGFTVAGRTAGTITPYIGSTAGTVRNTNATFSGDSIVATNDEYVKFVPSADFNGKISAVTVTDSASDLKALTAKSIAERINLDTATSLCTAYVGLDKVGLAEEILVVANTQGITPTFTPNGAKVTAQLAFATTISEANLETAAYFRKDYTAEVDSKPTVLVERNAGTDYNFLY
jgi:hypothetical protein